MTTPADLRAGARHLWETQTRPPWDNRFLRPGDMLIAEIPSAPGSLICVGLVPQRDGRKVHVALQTMRIGPRGMRAALTSKIFVPDIALPLFGEALATAMEIAGGEAVGLMPNGDVWSDERR